jgi:hypothetical protein
MRRGHEKDFSKCNALIYDTKENLLVNAKIWEHDDKDRYIVVQDFPELKGVENCRLLILTSPAPYAYTGVIRKHGLHKLIKMYEEHTEESRKEIRYKMDLPGYIESLIYEGKANPLHTMAEVRIVNISRSGLRMCGRENTINVGDGFVINLKIGENDKSLKGEVMNDRALSPEKHEYGCKLFG